jgi:hypothetical protein
MLTLKCPTRAEEFDASLRQITQERGAVYGHPLDQFERAQAIKQAIACCPDPACRNALEMIAEKMARLCTTPDHIDSWIDIGGYARTAVMSLDERDRRSEADGKAKEEDV